MEVLLYLVLKTYRLCCQRTRGKLMKGTRIQQEPGKKNLQQFIIPFRVWSHIGLWCRRSFQNYCPISPVLGITSHTSWELCQSGTQEPTALRSWSQTKLPQRLDFHDRGSNTKDTGQISPRRTQSSCIAFNTCFTPKHVLKECIIRNSEIE